MATYQETTNSDETISKTDQFRVLVVDDDREIAESIRFTLDAEGYAVSVASDGNQCLAYIEAQELDLVILDMMMPRRSGFLVLERLRQYSDSLVPVIVITGNEGTRHRQYAQMLGVSDYIQKPFTMERLLDSVSNLLEK